MRKLIFLVPLMFMPALAGASHGLVEATYKLDARAERVERQIAHLRGNWWLKQEAREFARATDRLVRQARRGQRPRKLARSLRRLNAEFYDLKIAAANAHMRYQKRKRLRRALNRFSRSLVRVEYALDTRWRRAGKKSRGDYRNAYYDDDSSDDYRRVRRYRH